MNFESQSFDGFGRKRFQFRLTDAPAGYFAHSNFRYDFNAGICVAAATFSSENVARRTRLACPPPGSVTTPLARVLRHPAAQPSRRRDSVRRDADHSEPEAHAPRDKCIVECGVRKPKGELT